MTTPAAQKVYEAQHEQAWEGARTAALNPQDKLVSTLPVIYGFNNGGAPNWLSGVLLAEDGTGEVYMPHDLGVLEGTGPDRHETFRRHYLSPIWGEGPFF